MRICFIAEGSYPYVLGGVSAWIQRLITAMPEHTFSILTIGATSAQRGRFVYPIPPNVTEVTETFLDLGGGRGGPPRLKGAQREALKDLIRGADCDWDSLFALAAQGRGGVAPLLLSRDFYDLAEEVCEQSYFHVPFTEFYWNVRSMMMPLFRVLRADYPRADLYHSVSAGYAGILGAMIKARTAKPYLLTEHGLYSREREEEIIKSTWLKNTCKTMWINFFYALSRKSYESADRVLTLFTKNKQIEVELGCPEEKIGIIPNGVDCGEPQPGGGRDGKITIGAIVRVVPIKDIFTLLYAFALAKAGDDRLQLFVLGPTDEDEDYYRQCLALVKSMGLRDVTFTGTVRTAEWLGRMDILALTSISEGQPFAVLEAMAAGKPCVTTDVGSCRELLQGPCAGIGPAGVVCPVMDHEQIGLAFRRLSADGALRAEMGACGHRRVRAAFTREHMVDGYRNLYGAYGG